MQPALSLGLPEFVKAFDVRPRQEEWIAAEGHECGASMWECYVAGPESGSDPSVWRTELNRVLVQ